MTNLKKEQPKAKILGYYDEEERAHLPENQKYVADYLIKSAQTVPCEWLGYDKGRLTSIMVLDPRKDQGYNPVILHTGDFKMEVFV
nr:MAG TPA: hypothetical protein [Caudoviricetes sp.]